MVSQTLNDFKNRKHENHSLYENYINPKIKKVMSILNLNLNYVRAEGCYVFDENGERYLDYNTGEGVISVGFNHPKVNYILKEIIDSNSSNMMQLNSNVLTGLLAEKLISKAPAHINMVYFSNSGAEAVESALKFARCATGKERIIHCNSSFHGLTLGSLSICGDPEFKEGFGSLLPNSTAVDFNNLEQLEKELSKKDVAAFITEPIQGRQVTLPEKTYLKEAERLCKKYNSLFILDEIQTALGRTGKFFALEHWDLEPDIILVAKALSGGMVPISATLMRKAIFEKVYFSLDRCYVHHTTYGGNNLAMAAGLATIEVIDDENLVNNCKEMGELILNKLNPMIDQFELLKDVRGLGLIFGIEFERPKSFKLKMGWDLIHKASRGLFPQVVVMPLHKEHKIITMASGYNDVIKCIPPLIIGEQEVNYFVNALEKVLENCHNSPLSMLKSVIGIANNTLTGHYGKLFNK